MWNKDRHGYNNPELGIVVNVVESSPGLYDVDFGCGAETKTVGKDLDHMQAWQLAYTTAVHNSKTWPTIGDYVQVYRSIGSPNATKFTQNIIGEVGIMASTGTLVNLIADVYDYNSLYVFRHLDDLLLENLELKIVDPTTIKRKVMLVDTVAGIGQLIPEGHVREATIWYGCGDVDQLRNFDRVAIRDNGDVRQSFANVGTVDYRSGTPIFRYSRKFIPEHVRQDLESDPYAFGMVHTYDVHWK